MGDGKSKIIACISMEIASAPDVFSLVRTYQIQVLTITMSFHKLIEISLHFPTYTSAQANLYVAI